MRSTCRSIRRIRAAGCSTAFPNNNTEHRALTKVDYTLNNQQSIFTRYLYAVYDNPATYDGKNVLTLSRTGQNNQAHSMVVGHNFVLSSFVNALRVTYNKTLNDRPLPEFFTATDLGSKVYSPLPGYMGINVTGNGFAVGNGGTNPGYFDSDSWQLADDVDIAARATIRSRSAATGSTPRSRR